MFKDNKLRLLMALVGFERLGIDDEPGATWIIPSALSARELHEFHDTIQKHRNNPVMHYGDEDPLSAEEMLRRKPSSRAEYDDDSDGNGIVSDGEEDFLFPGGGGPTNTNRKSAALEELKKTRRKRRLSGDEDGLDPEMLEARRKARIENDLEKWRKIKSSEFVIDSDDEDEDADRLFFQKEEERRKTHAAKVKEALLAGGVNGGKESGNMKTKRRKSNAGRETAAKKSKISAFYSDSEDDGLLEDGSSLPPSRAVSVSSEDESHQTPLSSPHIGSSQEEILRDTNGNAIHSHHDGDTIAIKDVDYGAMSDESDQENASSPSTKITRKIYGENGFPLPTTSPPKKHDAQEDSAALFMHEPQSVMERIRDADANFPRRRRAVLEDSDDE